MSDKEKVAWFKALVTVWAPGFALAFMGMIGSPASKGGQLADIQFWAFASPTAIYLLILSWRVAYLSGEKMAHIRAAAPRAPGYNRLCAECAYGCDCSQPYEAADGTVYECKRIIPATGLVEKES